MILHFSVLATLVTGLVAVAQWHFPSGLKWTYLVAAGSFGAIGQLFMTLAYVHAPSSRIALFGYFGLVFSYGWSVLFLGEALVWAQLLGAGCIAAAGLIALRGAARR